MRVLAERGEERFDLLVSELVPKKVHAVEHDPHVIRRVPFGTVDAVERRLVRRLPPV
jgi:hypothetical protein